MINTDAIRSNLKLIGAAALPIYWRQSLREMADEIDRLRAELRNRDERILDLENELAANGLTW
jgi:hypothetical protein